MDGLSDDVGVDNEVTRRNMQLYVTWKTITKGDKGFGDNAEECETSL